MDCEGHSEELVRWCYPLVRTVPTMTSKLLMDGCSWTVIEKANKDRRLLASERQIKRR